MYLFKIYSLNSYLYYILQQIRLFKYRPFSIQHFMAIKHFANQFYCSSLQPQEVIDMSSLFLQMKKVRHKEIFKLSHSVLIEKLGLGPESWNFPD